VSARDSPYDAVRLILAIQDEEERAEAGRVLGRLCPGWKLSFPEAIADVERIYSSDQADAIVTDFGFHSGALAEWLTLWPLPAILLVGPSEDPERIERTVRDEASLFLRRTEGYSHLPLLPVLVRKILNIRESVARQNAQIQMTEHQYMNLVQAIPDIVYTLDSEGRFLYLNDAVGELGFEPHALIGKHFSEIVHPDDVPQVSRSIVLPSLAGTRTGDELAPKLFDERRSGKRMTKNLEIRLRKASDGGAYARTSINCYGEVNCSGFRLPEYEGAGLGTMGIIRDVTLRKLHERELENEIASKEVLLMEIHHRVKNNLQVVSSLLNLQEGSITDPAARKIFTDCQTQIQSMSMVHEVLYNSASLEGVEMQPYFERLVEYLSNLYEGAYRGISWEVDAGEVSLDLERAIPVALIVNELVSNAYKHAFPEGRPGAFRITARAEDGRFRFEVEDDGVGLSGVASGAASGPASGRGIGTDLVVALAAQIKGEASFSAGRSGSGTLVAVGFPA
jgi:PAS domain S-box-containing protein